MHRGRLDFFDNQVSPKTGTIRIRAIFPNDDRALMHGLFATVHVPAGPPVSALMVPDLAITPDQNYKLVLVVNRENVVESRMIKTGRAHGPWRAVLEGLTPQDRVIVNGLMSARRGIKVEAREQTATEESGGNAGRT